MEDLIIYGLGGLLGGLIGWLFASAIIKYCKKALDWFKSAFESIPRCRKAIGVLVREGRRVFKRLWVQFTNGEESIYEEEGDVGVEMEAGELPDDIEKALNEQGIVAVWSNAE